MTIPAARATYTAAALLLALTGCGTTPTPAAKPATAAPATPIAAPAQTPSFDPDIPNQLGTRVTLADKFVDATVFGYKQPVATADDPAPYGRPGYVWAATDIRVCVRTGAPTDITVSNRPWRLEYADDTRIDVSSAGYRSIQQPEYPWGDNPLPPGRCLRGWITYAVPASTRPAFVSYGPQGQRIPLRWAVK